MLLGQRRQPVGLHVVLARGGADGEQPLLQLLQLVRIELGVAHRLVERVARGVECDERGIDRLERRVDEVRRLRLAPVEPAQRAVEAGHEAFRCENLLRVAQVDDDFFRALQVLPALGQHRLLAGLDGELRQLLVRVTQVVGLGADRRDARLLGAPLGLDRAHPRMRFAHVDNSAREATEGVDQLAMHRRLHHRTVVVLTVDLDQRATQRAQDLGGDGLVVDEGAGAPVGGLNAAQDQLAVDIDVLAPGEDAGGVVWWQVEDGDHLALRLPLAHQRAVTARPERQGEGIEQD